MSARLRSRSFEIGSTPAEHGDVGAATSEGEGDGLADSGRGSSDDCVAVSWVHPIPSGGLCGWIVASTTKVPQ
jgi:hypothetical protein